MKVIGEHPRVLKLEVVRGCNLRCPHCNVADKRRLVDAGDFGVMSQETFARIEPELTGFEAVALDNKGEPLMNPRLEQIIRTCHENGCHTVFSSNMMLMTEERARGVLEAGLSALTVSIDGASAETFARWRLGGELAKFFDNLERFVRVGESLGRKVPIAAVFVANRDNVAELPALVDRLGDAGVERLAVNGMEPYEERFAGDVLYSSEAVDPAAAAIFAVVEQAGVARGMAIDLPALTPSWERVCEIPDWSVTVSWKGDVHPCFALAMPTDFFAFGERHRHEVVQLGNVNDAGLADIWGSARSREFRARVARNELPTACSGCLIRTGVICR